MDEPTALAENKNVARLTDLPPQLLEAIGENPDASRPYYRHISTIVDHELYCMRNELPVGQRIALADRWSKLGGMQPKEALGAGGGAGFSIQINIPAMNGALPSSTIIEGHATPVDEVADAVHPDNAFAVLLEDD